MSWKVWILRRPPRHEVGGMMPDTAPNQPPQHPRPLALILDEERFVERLLLPKEAANVSFCCHQSRLALILCHKNYFNGLNESSRS